MNKDQLYTLEFNAENERFFIARIEQTIIRLERRCQSRVDISPWRTIYIGSYQDCEALREKYIRNFFVISFRDNAKKAQKTLDNSVLVGGNN